MRFLLFASAAFATVTIVPETASAKPLACPGLVDGATSPLAAEQFYAARAVDIVRAGLKRDKATLNTLVAAEARVEIWRGDSSSSPRQNGVPAILDMVQEMKPTGFQVSTVRPGPIHIIVSECKWSAAVLFRTEEADTGVAISFDFVDGLLVRAKGNEVVLSEGSID
jgi:hypothetical protein